MRLRVATKESVEKSLFLKFLSLYKNCDRFLILFGPKVPLYYLGGSERKYITYVLIICYFTYLVFHFLMQTHLHIDELRFPLNPAIA